LKLSVIVPAFNEEGQICQSLDSLQQTIQDFTDSYEILVVSDGSTDNTFQEACQNNLHRVSVWQYPENQGKGYALKYGFARSKGEYIVFIDADMEISPRSIKHFFHLLEQNGYDIIVGSKRHPQSIVSYPLIRRIYSATYQQLNKILFDLNIRDTQVGLKMFKREVLEHVCPRILVKRYAFDLEVLAVAHHFGFNKTLESPIELDYKFKSSINIKDVLGMLIDTLAIFYRLRVIKYYNQQSCIKEKQFTTYRGSLTDITMTGQFAEEQKIQDNKRSKEDRVAHM